MGTMPPGLAAYMAKKKAGGVSPNIQAAAASRVAKTAETLPAASAKKKSGKKFAPKTPATSASSDNLPPWLTGGK